MPLSSINLAQPHNAQVLRYLKRANRDAPDIAAHDSIPNPYYQCGCHPDIVERVWDQIGAAMPADCRCLVTGMPALVHPTAGVIFALAIGTQYGLRLPGSLASAAVSAGAKTSTRWSTGATMDIRSELGDDWVFGAWLADEFPWCKSVYAIFDLGAAIVKK